MDQDGCIGRLAVMRKILLVSLLVILVTTPAGARWRHHHHHRGHAYSEAIPQWHDRYGRERTLDAPQEMVPGESAQESRVPTGQPPDGQQPSTGVNTVGDLLLPQGWQRQPGDPNWQGERFLSPDGTASLSAYITPVAQEPIAQHMKAVAFVDGEQITHLRGGRSWVEVSGFKGDRIFYRKSVLACGGTSWHEVAFEYPAEAQGMNAFVDQAAHGVEMNRDKGCAAAVAASNGSSDVSEQPPAVQDSSPEQ